MRSTFLHPLFTLVKFFFLPPKFHSMIKSWKHTYLGCSFQFNLMLRGNQRSEDVKRKQYANKLAIKSCFLISSFFNSAFIDIELKMEMATAFVTFWNVKNAHKMNEDQVNLIPLGMYECIYSAQCIRYKLYKCNP